MKQAIATVILVLLGGCVTQHETAMPQNIIMMLQNEGQPFVSGRFAERLALLVIDEKYGEQFFRVRGSPTVTDSKEMWLVTLENGLISPQDKSALPMFFGKILPRHLTITIRKTNGEIVAIS
jgi:hypothetical protein